MLIKALQTEEPALISLRLTIPDLYSEALAGAGRPRDRFAETRVRGGDPYSPGKPFA